MNEKRASKKRARLVKGGRGAGGARSAYAPTLKQLVADASDIWGADGPVCARELRALLAVAAAADRDISKLCRDLGEPRENLIANGCTTGKLARALERLSRASEAR